MSRRSSRSTKMLQIEPYRNLSDESETEMDVNEDGKEDPVMENGSVSESLREEMSISPLDSKSRDSDKPEEDDDTVKEKSVKKSWKRSGGGLNRKGSRHHKDQRPATAPWQGSSRSSKSVRSMPKGSWQQEHVVSLMNTPPFPTFAKSVRLTVSNDKKIETKSRGTQYSIKMKSHMIQVCPNTTSLHCQTVGEIVKEQYSEPIISTNGLDEINNTLTALYSLLKDVDCKADDVKEQESQALQLLENFSGRETPPNIDEKMLADMREQLNKISGLIDNDLGPNNTAENIVLFTDQGMHKIQKQIEDMSHLLANVSAPVIQSDDGKGFTLSMDHYQNSLKQGLDDLKNSINEIVEDCRKMNDQLSNIERQVGRNSDTRSDEILARVNDVYNLLNSNPQKNIRVFRTRTPYTGPCKCASIINGHPKRLNNEAHIEKEHDPCQKCTNDYRGRVFIHIHCLPGETNQNLHAVLGQILECLECDNNIYLIDYMRDFRGNAPGWQDDDFSRCYVALFKCSLGWNNVRCPGVLASYLDISALINFQLENDNPKQKTIDLDVLGQLLCRIESDDRRKMLNTENLRMLLFDAVQSHNVTAFRFLVSNFAPLAQMKHGKSVLHEIIKQSELNRDSDDVANALLSMVNIIYENAGQWWEWNSGVQYNSEDHRQANRTQPSSDSSDEENESSHQYNQPKELKIEQSENREDFRQNALRYLLSIKDNFNRCPLAYAIQAGAGRLAKKILSEPPYQFAPDPLEFTQCSRQRGYIVENIEGRFAPRGQSVLDRLTLQPPSKGNTCLLDEPFKTIVNDKWHRYMVFGWLWFMFYMYYMVVLSLCVVYRPIGRRDIADIYEDSGDIVRLLGEITIFLGIFFFFYAELRDYIRMGWVWPWPWTFHGLQRIINALFVVFIIAAIILRFTANEKEDIALAFALLLGWMNTIYFLVLVQTTRLMPYMLHVVFTKDLCGNFMIIFAIAMVAWSVSTFCICQGFIVPRDAIDEEGFWFYPFTLYRLLAGVVDTEYVNRSRDKGMGHIIFLLFIWIMVFFLIKILISMIIYTYWDIKKGEDEYCFWLKAWMVQLIERRLLPCMYVQYEKKKTCLGKMSKSQLEYAVLYDLRKNSKGEIVELPQHAVFVPMEP